MDVIQDDNVTARGDQVGETSRGQIGCQQPCTGARRPFVLLRLKLGCTARFRVILCQISLYGRSPSAGVVF